VNVRLHRCSDFWFKVRIHPCWRVQKALDEAGIGYEVVPHPTSRSKRRELRGKLNQALLPVIEFGDGMVYREESKEMAKRIREGRLFELVEAERAKATAERAG
jgi:hypothetical protein